MERAHVVQPVGELDEQHADVVAQREQELAEILGGALILRLRLDLRQLGHPVDQPRDVLAEQPLDLFGRRERVLDRVVEDRGDDRLVVELQVGEDPGDFDRVAEIGIARGAHLRAVRLHREDVGAVDQPLVRIGIIGPDLLDKFILSQHASKMGEAALLCKRERKGAAAQGSEAGGPAGKLLRGERGTGDLGGRALQRSSSAAANARPSTTKLSIRPACLASDWHSTTGPAFLGRALAGGGSAVPDDVAGNDRSAVGTTGLAE